jgi:hypothetical protein
VGSDLIPVDTTFSETTTLRRVQEVPYSHVSIELDHLYMEDFARDRAHLRNRIAQIAPWYHTAVKTFESRGLKSRPRISTCFLVDDYFTELKSPAELIPMLLEAAEDVGISVDYVARESGCAVADGVDVARMVAGRLVSIPVEGTNGSRPPVAESGWLSNGQRSPMETAEALREHGWMPPVEAEVRNHSIFVDVQLWSEKTNGDRLWSCPMLAAVWQLARLGLLRHHGRTVTEPRPLPTELPHEWSAMPPVSQVKPSADPFHGYQTLSLLDDRFLSIEHAVRVILNQVAQDGEVMQRIEQRALKEGMRIAEDVTGRIAYLFMTDF